MNKLFKNGAFTILSFVSVAVFGATSINVQIDRIATQDDGTIILYAKNGWGPVANNGCSSGTGVLAFKSNTEGGKALLSTALTAHTTQKFIVVSTYDSVCLPVGGMAPTIQRIDLLN